MILAAGLGERLSADDKSGSCKPLKKVNGIPLISYSLDLLKKSGVDCVIIVVGKYIYEIKESVGDSYDGMKIYYEIQSEQKGLAHAIFCGSRNCTQDVVLALADELFIDPKPVECVELFKEKSLDFLVSFTQENDEEKIKSNFSFLTEENGSPYGFVEKPTKIVNSMKGTGFCVLSSRSISLLKEKYDELENFPNTLCDFFEMLISENMKGGAFEFAEKEVNVNTFEDLKQARSLFETEE